MPPAIHYRVEATRDLSEIREPIRESSGVSSAAGEVVITDTILTTGHAQRLLRLRVERP